MFTALGLYPVNPSSCVYMIGSPLFARETLHLPNGKTFVIAAANNSAANLHIQSATLNGTPLSAPCIAYSQIQAGGTLNFVIGPSLSRCAASSSGTPLPNSK